MLTKSNKIYFHYTLSVLDKFTALVISRNQRCDKLTNTRQKALKSFVLR